MGPLRRRRLPLLRGRPGGRLRDTSPRGLCVISHMAALSTQPPASALPCLWGPAAYGLLHRGLDCPWLGGGGGRQGRRREQEGAEARGWRVTGAAALPAGGGPGSPLAARFVAKRAG
jgi:hypothetical protein